MSEIAGVHPTMPADTYHEQRKFIGSSSLAKMDLSPRHFYQAWTIPSGPTAAMFKGNLIHSLLLEQDIERFVRRPLNEKGDLVRSNSKEYAAFLAENPGKEPVHPDDFDPMYDMLTSFCDNERAMAMMNKSRIEHSVFAQDPESGLLLKARPDIWGSGFISDLKSTSNMRGFNRQIFALMYDVKLAHYAKVIEYATGEVIDQVYYIAHESNAPYCSQIFTLSKDDFKAAKEKWRILLNQISVCSKTGNWPGYSDEIHIAEKPKYFEEMAISFEEVV